MYSMYTTQYVLLAAQAVCFSWEFTQNLTVVKEEEGSDDSLGNNTKQICEMMSWIQDSFSGD